MGSLAASLPPRLPSLQPSVAEIVHEARQPTWSKVWEELIVPDTRLAFTKKGEDPLKESLTLRPSVVAAIEEVRRTHEVVVLEKRVNDVSKTVVLLGEYHLKSPASKEAANKLIEQFSYFGLEGVDPKKYWLGEVSWWIESSRRRLAKNFLSLKSTSIDDAGKFNALTSQLVHRLAQEIRNRKLSQSWIRRKGEALSIQTDEEVVMTLSVRKLLRATIKYEIDGKWLSIKGRELFSAALRVARQDSTTKGNKSFDLEDTHTPGVLEQMSFLNALLLPLPLLATWGITATRGMCSKLLKEDLHPSINSRRKKVIWGVPAYFLLSLFPTVIDRIGGSFLSETTRESPLFRTITYDALERERSATMSNRINELFYEHPQMDSMLSIVGKAHVASMKIALKEKGWVVKKLL